METDDVDERFPGAGEEQETVSGNDMTARPYQVELLERAKERNIIVCLGTGTGKTFISVMLIKELAHEVRTSYESGGKRTFFLVNTVPLASQQARVIDRHTDLSVRHYVGEMGVDLWKKGQWEKEFNEHNVLVMTAQIFLDLLLHGFVGLSQVNLLIFDECHHAKKKDPYKQIMQLFDNCPSHQYPRVMGLTASIVNGKVKPWKLEAEIRELEEVLRSTCETSQDRVVEMFAAKPREELVTFNKDCLSEDNAILIQILGDVLKPGQDFLRDCRVEWQNETVKNAYTFAKFTLRECLETLETLGPWAANRVAEYMVKDLDWARTFQDDKEGLLFCELCATTLRQLQGYYRNFTDNGGQFYIMPKLEKLLSILKDYRNTQAEEGKQLCGIVFVERRYAALVLSEAINIIAAQDHELNFIKSKFVTGHSTGRVNYSNQTDMNFKKQEEVLRQFRKHEFNLLVATSVVEEGLDIPKCNVVCRFDFPNNFRSYVQSKGRARAKNSRYIMLVEQQEKTEKEGDLELLREIEKFLQTLCHDRTLPSEEESTEAVDTDFLPPYMPRKGEGQARVTMSSGISLLSRYCSKLPGDRFTRLKPVYTVEEVGREAYKCILQMPNNCPLRDNILGPPMPQKKLAKMAVALLTCEQLHKMGELDDNLFPVRTLSDEESEGEEDEEERGGKKAGTKKRRRLYERKVPDAFTGSLPLDRKPLYLTVITITITNITNRRELDVSEQMFVDDSCRVFGLLTKRPLPPVRPFKLFPNYGEVTVSLEPQLKVDSVRDLDTCQRFHCLLFSHVLRVRVEADPESLDGYFVVLLTPSCEVDTGRMKKLLTLAETASDYSVIEKGAVVTKKYTESRKHKERFAVVEVRRDLCSSSPFPERSKASTFDAYFNQEYGVNIKNKNQPLLEVKHLSGRVNFLVDRSKVKSKGGVIQLPQELCDSIGFPASLLSVCVTLPSILHRVNSLLLVTDLRRTIAGAHAQYSDDELESELLAIGVDDGSYTMEEENMDETEEEFPGLCSQLEALFPNNRSTDVGPPLPDSALLLQALTTTHATDAFNLERLEMLGDSFLKLAVSLYLFCNYKDKDEGKLTERKVRQISNLALFRAAEKKSLGGYLQSTQLARDVWCPLGCRVSEGSSDRRGVAMELDEETDDITMATNDDAHETRASVSRDASCSSHHQDTGEETVLSAVEHAQQKCTTQRIADKSVADSIEGLIGAYLISCGYTGALHFMKFLGLKVLPEDDNDDDGDLVGSAVDGQPGKYASLCFNPTNAFLGVDRNEITLSHMMSGLESFEKSINYKFQSKLYLLEALTHASYHANRVTVCYQRLEFLGDALLDFLVTQHLYFRHANLSPGQLTDVRQALVNNNIFATIAVKYEYHKYLKQMSPQWFKKIENFINRVEDEKPGGKVSADSFIIVSEEDEEGIEAPKVLGDIFESVAGAVFLDSGMDLTKIWRVYYRMMKPYIDHYSCNVPINPIRGVYENDAEAEFGKAETLPDGRIKRTVRVHWGEFVGKGANGRIAKLTAAKLAIKALNRAQQTTPTSSM